eukprot:TRINITY_DN5013_c0_g2_i1.p2 TRINITY_DN5013_c0_g2~~TRINITY_DN5013_c0_g2_i1.p2  ORF type:complete len:253 (+),score=63.51 TRINITY_DN5013_c0_g2_i1:1218-1976(+)
MMGEVLVVVLLGCWWGCWGSYFYLDLSESGLVQVAQGARELIRTELINNDSYAGIEICKGGSQVACLKWGFDEMATDLHLTLLFFEMKSGGTSEEFDEIMDIMAQIEMPPLEISFSGTDLFINPGGAVLKFNVLKTPQLEAFVQQLNNTMMNRFGEDFKPSMFSFIPHITIFQLLGNKDVWEEASFIPLIHNPRDSLASHFNHLTNSYLQKTFITNTYHHTSTYYSLSFKSIPPSTIPITLKICSNPLHPSP